MSPEKDCSSNALIFEKWWEIIAEQFGPNFHAACVCVVPYTHFCVNCFWFQRFWSIYYHFDDTEASKYTGTLILTCYMHNQPVTMSDSFLLSVTAWPVLDFIFKWKHLSTSLSVVISSFINVSSFTKLHPNWKVTYEYMDMQVCWLHLCLRFHTAPSFCY